MRMKSLTKYLGALALFAAVTVHAQATPPAPDAGPTAAAPVPLKLSIPQMKERAAGLEAQIKDDARHMRHLQEVARKEKDVVKLTCVNDRLVELKVQQNIYDLSNQQFHASAGGDNADATRPSFDELGATAGQIKQLRGETEACIGVPDLYKQESDISVTHPDFPDEPTTSDPFEPVIDQVEPPAYASPFS